MIDLETMIKSRLAWLKWIFNGNDGTWKRYLKHRLKSEGGLFFINCNYDFNDYTISSQFYHELLLWWSQFRETFASESNWQKTIWNNKEIRIDKKPVYFKNYYESGIVYVNDLLFNISTNYSFDYFAKQISKINILQWAGLRHSIPDFLKGDYTSPPLTSPSFLNHDNIFDVTKKKSKDYYLLLVTEKAQLPNIIYKWKTDFNVSDDQLREFFLLPHSVVLGSYVKAFQYKVLHNVL